jgi:hypothetical protein
VLLVGGAFCITDEPVFKLPLVVVTLGMMVTLFVEENEEARFRRNLLEAEERATQPPTTTLMQDIRVASYREEVNRRGELNFGEWCGLSWASMAFSSRILSWREKA